MFSKFVEYALWNAFLIVNLLPIDILSKCLISKIRSFGFPNGVSDFYKIVWWDRCTHLPKSFQTYCPIISFLRTANDVEGALLDLKQTRVNSAFLYLSCFVYMTLRKCHDSKILKTDTRIRYNIETQIYCNSVFHANMEGYHSVKRSCSLVVNNVSF